jgi:iron-sulfur cluster assembly accessory protein
MEGKNMTPITITPAANHQIGKLCQENDCYAITLNVKGGGCAGFEYEWGTANADELTKDDIVISCDMGTFAVGAGSLMFLLGCEIDYTKSIIGSTFEIKNPNAQSSCGCGVSVNFDMDKLDTLANPAI